MKIVIEIFSCLGCPFHQEDHNSRDVCNYNGTGGYLWSVDTIPDDCPARKDEVIVE